MARKKYKGTCIYCDFYGKMSKEHIFPDWLGEYFKKEVQRFDTVHSHSYGLSAPKIDQRNSLEQFIQKNIRSHARNATMVG